MASVIIRLAAHSPWRWQAASSDIRPLEPSMTHFPGQLETERLLLRQFTHDDWPSLHEHYSDPECTRFTFRRALSEGESWRAMCSMVGHWAIRGYGPFAAVQASTGKVIGAVGLWYPNDWPEPEIKWALSRQFWGQGFASEAVRAIQRPAYVFFGNKAPISFINAENQPSVRLAVAVGARHERTVECPIRRYGCRIPARTSCACLRV